eukprot:PITA_02251
MARSMLTFNRLSPTYWAEAIHTAVYMRNRSPTASLDGITPYEAWFGFKPRVKHLRVFGSICYALIPKEKRTKLDSRSLKRTMIGYSNEKKGCHLLTNGKFIVSRDVIFDETEKAQTSEHQLPKWAVQLLKDVKPDEQNKTGTKRAHRSEGNFAMLANDFTEPSTYKEAVKHKEWQQAMVEEYQAVIVNNT